MVLRNVKTCGEMAVCGRSPDKTATCAGAFVCTVGDYAKCHRVPFSPESSGTDADLTRAPASGNRGEGL